MIDGRPVVATATKMRPGNSGRSIIDVTLTEGRNRIVRRWCEAMGLKVERLARLSYGPVRLGDLKPGESRLLTPKEEAAIYSAIGLAPNMKPLRPRAVVPAQFAASPLKSPAHRRTGCHGRRLRWDSSPAICPDREYGTSRTLMVRTLMEIIPRPSPASVA
jgi:hypothetical protein